jgi:adenylate cyclase
VTGREPVVATSTIMFTDLVGFTEYTDACGDAAAVEVLDRQATIARAALDHGEGRLVKELGDGLMFWFEHPEAALRSAVVMLDAVDRARDTRAFPLGVRMGMHCGDVTARGDDFVGRTVNVAARIADLAGPGELLVSDGIVAAITPDRATFDPVGPVRVKGVAAPIWLHRLATAQPV